MELAKYPKYLKLLRKRAATHSILGNYKSALLDYRRIAALDKTISILAKVEDFDHPLLDKLALELMKTQDCCKAALSGLPSTSQCKLYFSSFGNTHQKSSDYCETDNHHRAKLALDKYIRLKTGAKFEAALIQLRVIEQLTLGSTITNIPVRGFVFHELGSYSYLMVRAHLP